MEAIALRGVSVVFELDGQVQTVLSQLDLDIHRGEWLAIVGRNGSGKTTLATVLSGLCGISGGRILYSGETMAEHPRDVQLVFQNPEAQIVGETVIEDVCFGLENLAVPATDMAQKAHEALAQVGLLRRAQSAVSSLSGGQKQLLCIADCLAMDAQIIVFDEATAMLDPASRRRVLETVRHLHQAGRTVVWITQWLDELAWADRIIALEEGRLAFEGPRAAFFYGAVTAPDGNAISPCEALGFRLPYTVTVAQELLAQGVPLRGYPVLPEELATAVVDACR